MPDPRTHSPLPTELRAYIAPLYNLQKAMSVTGFGGNTRFNIENTQNLCGKN
jgi:hypothetical protein